MHRRLAQIGLVEAEDAVTLQKKLNPGQRLVSRDGGLWRWDGLTAAADAPTMAARRLAEKNRLGELELSVMHARASFQKFQREMEAAQADVRQAAEALSQAREARAGSMARHEAAVRRVAQTTRQTTETLETSPSGLLELAGLKSGDALLHPDEIEDRLASLKIDRERLGAVNLRAEEELQEIEGKKNNIVAERDDLQETIKRLRQAISNLNREGRERPFQASVHKIVQWWHRGADAR